MSQTVSTLAELSIGSRATVTAIHGTDDISVRLFEMGLLPGTEFTLLGCAPLGDPLEIELRGYRLSLRRSEASRVEITPA
jgi:ferrous iron transport protein A